MESTFENYVRLEGEVVSTEDRTERVGRNLAEMKLFTAKVFHADDGDIFEKREYHWIIDERSVASTVQIAKGSRVRVEGELRTRKWTDEHGLDHYRTEVIATSVQSVG